MTRDLVWFNRTFSSIHAAVTRIRVAGGSYRVACSHPVATALPLLVADEAFVEPSLSRQDYVEWCAKTCVEKQVAVFVPGHGVSQFADIKTEFERETGSRLIIAATPKVLALLNDKAAFCRDIETLPWTASMTIPVRTLDEFREAYRTVKDAGHAVCVKPSHGVFGNGFKRIREDKTEWDIMLAGDPYTATLAQVERAIEQAPAPMPELLVMEYLPGAEFSVDCVAKNGDLIAWVSRRKPTGTNRPQTIDQRHDVGEAVRAFADRYALDGYFNAQFREGTHGLRVLEINARMSGGTGMSCEAGVNLPLIGLLAEQGRSYHHLPLTPTHGAAVCEFNQAVLVGKDLHV